MKSLEKKGDEEQKTELNKQESKASMIKKKI